MHGTLGDGHEDLLVPNYHKYVLIPKLSFLQMKLSGSITFQFSSLSLSGNCFTLMFKSTQRSRKSKGSKI